MVKQFITYVQNFKYCFNKKRIGSALSFVMILWLNAFAGSAWSQQNGITVESLSFTGNGLFTTKTLLEYSGISVPGMYDIGILSEKLQQVLSLYQQNGYYFARIDSVNLGQGRRDDYYKVHVYLKEGVVLKLGSITMKGALPGEEDALSEFIPAKGTVYSPHVTEKFIQQVTHYYGNYGYPYVSVMVEQNGITSINTLNDMLVDIVVKITKNKRVSVDSISVIGLENTKADVIIRESRLHAGDVFREERLIKAKEYVQKLSFISDVSFPELFELKNGKSLVRFAVRERNSNKFNGLVGYVPSSGQENGYYIGTFLIDFSNLFGTGRSLQAEWQKLDVNSQLLRVFYEEPWVIGLPVTVNGQFEQSIQDSSFVKRTFTLGLRYRLNSTVTAHAFFGREHVIADLIGRETFNLSNSRSSFYTIGISFDKLDYQLNPRKGISYATYVTQQNRKLNSDSNPSGESRIFDRKIRAEIEFAIPVTDKFVSYLKGVWKQTTGSGKTISVSQQWYLGGARSLRGYREKQFLAGKVAWYNLEFRYLVNRESRLFLFWDGGFFQNQGESPRKKFGYGLGIRIDSRLGMIGFDLGLGQGDTFSTAKLHIFLNNAF